MPNHTSRLALAAIAASLLALAGCSSEDTNADAPAATTPDTATSAVQTSATPDLTACTSSTAKFENDPDLLAAAPANPDVKVTGVQHTADHGEDTRTAIYYYLCAPGMGTEDLTAYGEQIVTNVKQLPIASDSKSVSLYNYVGNDEVGHIRCKAPALTETLTTMGACTWQTTW